MQTFNERLNPMEAQLLGRSYITPYLNAYYKLRAVLGQDDDKTYTYEIISSNIKGIEYPLVIELGYLATWRDIEQMIKITK
jgi:hypothetical protein